MTGLRRRLHRRAAAALTRARRHAEAHNFGPAYRAVFAGYGWAALLLPLGRPAPGHPVTEPGKYLAETPFNDRNYYSVVIGEGGLTVYSECCADTMNRACAARVHEALGRWLTDNPERPA